MKIYQLLIIVIIALSTIQFTQAQIQLEVEGVSLLKGLTTIDATSTNPFQIKSNSTINYTSIHNSNGYRGYFGIYTGVNDMDFGTGGGNPTGKTHLVTQAVPRLTVDAIGRVGIGTTTPSTELEIVGTVTATHIIGDGSGITNLPPTSSVWSTSANNTYYNTGNVGINTASPDSELHINSDGSSFGSSKITMQHTETLFGGITINSFSVIRNNLNGLNIDLGSSLSNMENQMSMTTSLTNHLNTQLFTPDDPSGESISPNMYVEVDRKHYSGGEFSDSHGIEVAPFWNGSNTPGFSLPIFSLGTSLNPWNYGHFENVYVSALGLNGGGNVVADQNGQLVLEGSALAPTKYYVVHPADFVGWDSQGFDEISIDGFVGNNSGSGIQSYYAPIHLPDGALIEAITYHYGDTDPSDYLQGYLTSSVNSGSFGSFDTNGVFCADCSITASFSYTVDNQNDVIQLNILPQGLWDTSGDTKVFRKAVIHYK